MASCAPHFHDLTTIQQPLPAVAFFLNGSVTSFQTPTCYCAVVTYLLDFCPPILLSCSLNCCCRLEYESDDYPPQVVLRYQVLLAAQLLLRHRLCPSFSIAPSLSTAPSLSPAPSLISAPSFSAFPALSQHFFPPLCSFPANIHSRPLFPSQGRSSLVALRVSCLPPPVCHPQLS